MATETAEQRASYRRSLKVTGTAALGGVIAGVASVGVVASATDVGVIVVPVAATLFGLGVMRLLGVDVSEFSTKDQLYVAFMTFSLWFITLAILLTENASPL